MTPPYPVVDAFIRAEPHRRVFLTAEHSELGRLSLADSSYAAWARATEDALADHEPAYEWIGAFEANVGAALPLIFAIEDDFDLNAPIPDSGERLRPRIEPTAAAQLQISYPTKALEHCRQNWSGVVAAIAAELAIGAVHTNRYLEKHSAPLLPLPTASNVLMREIELSPRELFVQVSIPFGDARLCSVDGERWYVVSCHYDSDRVPIFR